MASAGLMAVADQGCELPGLLVRLVVVGGVTRHG
jgi:hypothetical protein